MTNIFIVLRLLEYDDGSYFDKTETVLGVFHNYESALGLGTVAGVVTNSTTRAHYSRF